MSDQQIKGGMVLVKHRKNERVATRQRVGYAGSPHYYIKVSACGGGKSDNVQCTAKKILYTCRMVHVKKEDRESLNITCDLFLQI